MMSNQRKYGQTYSQSVDFWSDDGDHAPATVAPRNNLVLPDPSPAYEITPADTTMLQQGGSVAGQVMRYEPYQQAKSQDTAETIAKASLLYSVAYGLVFGGIAFPVGLIAYFGFGMPGWDVALTVFLGWGCFTMLMLWRNRAQGLHHSATGIAHHEIDSRERIALHAINRHVELVEKRWSSGRE